MTQKDSSVHLYGSPKGNSISVKATDLPAAQVIIRLLVFITEHCKVDAFMSIGSSSEGHFGTVHFNMKVPEDLCKKLDEHFVM